MKSKGFKLLSAGLALSIALSAGTAASISAGATTIGVSGDVIFDESGNIIEGTFVEFEKPFGGFKGVVFDKVADRCCLVREDNSLYYTFKESSADYIDISTSDGNVRIYFTNGTAYEVQLQTKISETDYDYICYSVYYSEVGSGKVRTSYSQTIAEDGARISSDETREEHKYADDNYWISTYTTSVVTEKGITLRYEDKVNYITVNGTWSWEEELRYESDFLNKVFTYTNISKGASVNTKIQSIDLSGAKPAIKETYTVSNAPALNYTAVYNLDENDVVTTKTTTKSDGTVLTEALKDTDVFNVNYASNVNEALESCKKALIPTGLKVVESTPHFRSGKAIWLPVLYSDQTFDAKETDYTDYGIDCTKIGSVDVTIKALSPSLFDGSFGGAIVLSSKSVNNDEHVWNDKQYWGTRDEALGIDTLSTDKPVQFVKTGDYTYTGTMYVDEENCVFEGYQLVQIAFQEWGADLSQLEVLSMVVKDNDGNVMISFDNNGQARLPVTISASNENTKAEVEWTAVYGATKYDVQRFENGEWKSIAQTEKTSYSDAGLAAGEYTYRVIAYVNDEIRAVSDSTKVEVTATIAKPQNVKVAASDGKITLSWDKVEGADKYNVYSYENGKLNLIASTTDNRYEVSNLTNGTEYRFLVRAANDALESEYSDSDVITATPSASKPPYIPSIPTVTTTTAGTSATTSKPEESKVEDTDSNDSTLVAPDEEKESGEPFVEGNDEKLGWKEINDQLEAADGGDTITIDMNGTTRLPKSVLDVIEGKDISIELDMGNGFVWTINGKNITNPRDIDLGVSIGSNIPEDVIVSLSGNRKYICITLEHNGEFGFKASLSIKLGKEHKGLFANLYYYLGSGKTELIGSGKIGKNGRASLDFNHASEYIVVVDDYDHSAKSIDGADDEIIAVPTDDDANPHTGVTLGLAAVLIAGAVTVASKKRKK